MADYSGNKIAAGSTTYVAEMDDLIDAVQVDMTVVETDMTAVEAAMTIVEGRATNIETKTDFITVIQPVDLDDMESKANDAVLNADTSTIGMSFVIDDDGMTSASATTIPTSESVVAYIGTETSATNILAALITVDGHTSGLDADTVDGAELTELTKVADLVSTANAKGASLVGVEDSGGYFTGNNVEAVLTECKNKTGWDSTAGPLDSTRTPRESFDTFNTSVSEIIIDFDSLSLSGTDSVLIQLADSGGYQTTGYVAAVESSVAFLANTTGFIVANPGTSAATLNGKMIINRRSDGLGGFSNTYTYSCILTDSSQLKSYISSGNVTLSGACETVRVGTTGSNTVDAGGIAVSNRRVTTAQ